VVEKNKASTKTKTKLAAKAHCHPGRRSFLVGWDSQVSPGDIVGGERHLIEVDARLGNVISKVMDVVGPDEKLGSSLQPNIVGRD